MDEHLNDFFNVYSCSPENELETKDKEGDDDDDSNEGFKIRDDDLKSKGLDYFI